MNEKIEVDDKIKVFISSDCEKEKYIRVRKQLKSLIDETGFTKAYIFEESLASTQAVVQNYLYNLDDSDVCIFLIDNADGVPNGVMKEIKRAKTHPKKSLYLFCNESQKEPTQIQKELIGAQGVKYYIVGKFDDFVYKGYQSLIDDISKLYSNYCKNRLIDLEFIPNQTTQIEIDAITFEALDKKLLKGIDKTKLYISKQIFSKSHREIKETSELDMCCEYFLHVLFGEKDIKEFNTFFLLSVLEEVQSEKLHEVVVNRWKAIQCYWNDDIDRCIGYKKTALKLARNNGLPNWIIQDILIDLRNLYNFQGQQNNQFLFYKAQKAIESETSVLFYPLNDRYDKYLYEQITKQIIKSSTRSPYTVVWGNIINRYADYLSNIYVTSVFNGSLTHILSIIDRLGDIAFNLCKEYSDWQFRVLLLKLAISKGNAKEINGFVDLFNDIFGKMNASDAIDIYKFCNSIPIKYKRDIAKLEAFKHLGYFFADEDYENISKEIINLIADWLRSEKPIIVFEDHIFEALKGNCYRIDKNIIIKFCVKIFDKKLYRFYDNALDLIANIGLENVDDGLTKKIIDEINKIVINEKTRNSCSNLQRAIVFVRKSTKDYTLELHQNVLELMPDFYEETYKLEINVDSQKYSEEYIYKYVSEIRERNKIQGEDGRYLGYAYNPFEIIKNIIVIHQININEKLLPIILEAAKETLFCPRQLLSDKVDAIKLIIFMKLNSKAVKYDFSDFIYQIENNKDVVLDGFRHSLCKQTNTTIQFNYMMMRMVFDNIHYGELLEYLGMYSEFEESEKIEALKTLTLIFESNYCSVVDENILFMLLQFVLGLSHDTNHDVRYHAIKTLLFMITPATKDPIFTQLSKTMDFDSVYIKNLIINRANALKNIDPAMLNFIMQKASIDNHYIIRNRGRKFIKNEQITI